MINRYKNVKTSIETLDANENFKLFLTYYEGGKKPLLLGMHLTYKDIYTTPTAQVSNHIRSVFRKFGNEFLRKIAPNDYFTIEQRTVDKENHKSIFCKFIKEEKVYIDVVEAHAMTQAWDQLLFQYDLSQLFCSGQILMVVQGPNGMTQRMSETGDSDGKMKSFSFPPILDDFLNKIIHTEKI